jgi:hypothetical protein
VNNWREERLFFPSIPEIAARHLRGSLIALLVAEDQDVFSTRRRAIAKVAEMHAELLAEQPVATTISPELHQILDERPRRRTPRLLWRAR